MQVLIIGGGGREHALAWKAARSPRVSKVFVAPGNAGTAGEPGVTNVAIAADERMALADFAASRRIELSIVGPEAPLVAGIVDEFAQRGLACFGPSRAAAVLEGSKAFTKDFLVRHGVATPRYARFQDLAAARAYIERQTPPLVVKADGLAAGKGVIIAQTREAALDAARDMLQGGAFGAAGRIIVVEEYVDGEEASFIVVTDGSAILPFASSQDHKRRDDGDRGPNTGGMGAYSPAPVIGNTVHRRIMEQVMEPVIRGMAAEGRRYRGFLYAGLMIRDDGSPSVLEFNCRCGDPETQPILMRLNSDLIEICEATLAGRLHEVAVDWDPRAALAVVMAAEGYPGAYRKDDVISGLEPAGEAEVKIFHAGTRLDGGRVLTAGGRVLAVCALGDDVGEAQARAYARAARVSWDGAYYRRDIGYRAVARERGA